MNFWMRAAPISMTAIGHTSQCTIQVTRDNEPRRRSNGHHFREPATTAPSNYGQRPLPRTAGVSLSGAGQTGSAFNTPWAVASA